MRLLLAILASAALPWASHAANAAESSDFGADVLLSYGYGSVPESSIQTIVAVAPEFRVTFTPRLRAVVSANLRLDVADELEPDTANIDTYSTLSRPAAVSDLGTLELRDMYLERRLEHGVLRVGKQQIAWGKLDGIKILDVLNPQNLREFILDDFSASRISLWSAYLDISAAGWRGEIAVIPDNTGHAIPTAGAWFELTAPRYRYGADSGDPAPRVVTDRESISIDSAAAALRLSRYFAALELGLMAYSGLDHEPLGRLANVGGEAVLERYYKRRNLYGVSAETAFGAFALRAELASQPNRTFNIRDPLALETVELDQVTAGVGLDIDGPLNTFINVQYVHDEVRSAPSTLVRPAEDKIFTVYLVKSFSYESFRVSARWYRSQELGDKMVSVALQYNPSDATRLRLAVDSFSGDRTGIFGQFANKDRVTISLEHTF